MSANASSPAVYDVVIIGGGPGGYVAAIRAAQLGLKAAVVEREEMGGICLNWGCIPSKALLRNAEVLSLVKRSGDFGIHVENVQADYGAALARCKRVVTTQVRGVNFLMRKNNVDVVRGYGKLTAANKVAVSGGADGERELSGRNVIIATGSRVRPLAGVAIDGQHIVSSKEVWGAETLPKSALIIGAGAIGVEFATVLNAYGTDVTLVEFLAQILPQEDAELAAELEKSFTRRGIKVLTATKVDGAEVAGGQVTVKLSPSGQGTKAGESQTLQVERVLLGAGFIPNSNDIGLEALGVQTERGFIVVDGQMKTNVPGVYAIGDVTGKLALAHTAFAQAELCAEVIAGHTPQTLDYNSIPRCTYSSPQIASIGLSEAKATAAGYEIKVGKFPFRPNGKAMAMAETEGFVKIVGDAKTGEILGAHMIGPEVTELAAEFSIARTLESTSYELAKSVHPHPTLSEVIAEAALAVDGLPIHL